MSGYTDTRGEWRPDDPITFAPVFVWPPKLTRFLIWLVNYLFTWNLFYLGIVLLSYYYLQPPLEEMKTFRASWIFTLFCRNMALVWIIYGGWHLYLYKFRKRGKEAKYCPRWQSTQGSTFLWNDQVYDNVFWSCASAVPIWTAYEVLTFWLYANDKIPYLDFQEHPVYFVLLFLLIPFWRELHFYLIHRLIHWKPLYNSVHYLHHYNINPGPWSGLAMHPVEHILYFSVVCIHWLVPSHPLHFLFNAQHTALTPAPSHTGFEGKLGRFLSFGSYFHYLHHRLFECNYGESTIPLDKWFGIFEDGSQTQTEKLEAASAYHKYRITNMVEESAEVKSFYLTREDGQDLKSPIPGQHLTFKIPFHEGQLCLDPGQAKGVKINYAFRSYSISDHLPKNQYRISVKKEAKGFVSSLMHSSLRIGDVIEAKGPRGSFQLHRDKGKHQVFIAAGIGITPILSMLKSAKKSKGGITVILAAKEEDLLCFKDEIFEVYRDHRNIKVHVFMSQKPAVEMQKHYEAWHFYHQRLDMAALKNILPVKGDFSFYMCGPEKMTPHFTKEIGFWKGKRSTICTESFGAETKSGMLQDKSKRIQVHFAKSEKMVEWDHEFSNILEFAASNEVALEAGCMFGECGACSTKLVGGSVAYNYQTATKPGNGQCLPCSCHPTTDITLEA